MTNLIEISVEVQPDRQRQIDNEFYHDTKL